MATTDKKIVLGLDIPKTVQQINADLKKLQKQLNQVKTTASLDTGDTIKQLSKQIAALQKQVQSINLKPKLDLGFDTGQIKKFGEQLGTRLAKYISDGIQNSQGSGLTKAVTTMS